MSDIEIVNRRKKKVENMIKEVVGEENLIIFETYKILRDFDYGYKGLFLINGEEKFIADMFEIYISEECFDKKLKESKEILKKFLGGTEDAKKEKNTNRRGKTKN